MKDENINDLQDEDKDNLKIKIDVINVLSSEFQEKHRMLEKENLFLKEQNKQLNDSNDKLIELIEQLTKSLSPQLVVRGFKLQLVDTETIK